MEKIKCLHYPCNGELIYSKEMEKKGRIGVFVCNSCKCTFSIVSVRKEPKCPSLKGESKITIITKITKKRGRPKNPIDVLHESMKENDEIFKGLNTGSKKKRGRPKKVIQNE